MYTLSIVTPGHPLPLCWISKCTICCLRQITSLVSWCCSFSHVAISLKSWKLSQLFRIYKATGTRTDLEAARGRRLRRWGTWKSSRDSKFQSEKSSLIALSCASIDGCNAHNAHITSGSTTARASAMAYRERCDLLGWTNQGTSQGREAVVQWSNSGVIR